SRAPRAPAVHLPHRHDRGRLPHGARRRRRDRVRWRNRRERARNPGRRSAGPQSLERGARPRAQPRQPPGPHLERRRPPRLRLRNPRGTHNRPRGTGCCAVGARHARDRDAHKSHDRYFFHRSPVARMARSYGRFPELTMRYHVLACDYDGTLAKDGHVDDTTLAALKRVRESGRKLALVTGRELDDLAATFAALDVFDQIVAENGALLYTPATRTGKPLAEPPSPELVRWLEERQVSPLSVGRSIIA